MYIKQKTGEVQWAKELIKKGNMKFPEIHFGGERWELGMLTLECPMKGMQKFWSLRPVQDTSRDELKIIRRILGPTIDILLLPVSASRDELKSSSKIKFAF